MKIYLNEEIAVCYAIDCNSDQAVGGECSEIGNCPDCPMDDD